MDEEDTKEKVIQEIYKFFTLKIQLISKENNEEEFVKNMETAYFQLKKVMQEIDTYFDKIVKDTNYDQNQWAKECAKVLKSFSKFEKLKEGLPKGINVLKENNLSDETNIEKLESILAKAKMTSGKIQAIKDKTSEYDVNYEMDAQEDNDDQQIQEVIMDLINNKEVLKKRREDLEKIHQTAAKLKDTTDIMAQVVNKHGEMLNEVEVNVDETKKNASIAKNEIIKANEMSKGNSKKMCCLITIIIISVVTISLILAAVFWPKDE